MAYPLPEPTYSVDPLSIIIAGVIFIGLLLICAMCCPWLLEDKWMENEAP